MNPTLSVAIVVPLLYLPRYANQRFSYLFSQDAKIEPGDLVTIPFGNRQVEGIVCQISNMRIMKMKTISSIVRKNIVTQREMLFLENLANLCLEPLSLLTKALVSVRRDIAYPAARAVNPKNKKTRFSLKIIQNKLAFQKYLKKSVSGQTLVLIPENIYFETIKRLFNASNKKLFFYSNRATRTEKTAILNSLSKKTNCTVVAAHSGIFLPFTRLTEIIVIEPALKSHRQWDLHPRYDARDAACILAKTDALPLTFYATLPAFELRALFQEKYAAAEIKWPVPRLILQPFGEPNIISQEILKLIGREMEQNGRVLIYHDSLGHESLYVCHACGHVMRCDQCGGLLQKHLQNLFCKSCKLIAGLFRAFCPRCGSPKLFAKKIGTGAIETKLINQFPNASVFRVDRESKRTNSPDAQDGKPLIIIGTQKIFSLFNEKTFTFCLVLDIATLANTFDYNALEDSLIVTRRLSNLLRVGHENNFFIQQPGGNSAFASAMAENKIDDLIKRDLDDRNHLKFPPFAALAIYKKEFSNLDSARKATTVLTSNIRLRAKDATIDGRVFINHKKHSGQIIIRSKKEEIVRQALRMLPNGWTLDFYKPMNIFTQPFHNSSDLSDN